jgi:hypothetical protein
MSTVGAFLIVGFDAKGRESGRILITFLETNRHRAL